MSREFAQAWQDMRDDGDIQFEPVELPERTPPPDWLIEALRSIGEFFAPLGEFFLSAGPALVWVAGGLVLALIAYLVWRIAEGRNWRRNSSEVDEAQWMPDKDAALALLEEADRLAAEGQYDAATHLLLQRSVGQIAEARPDLIEPSSTAREIAAQPALPDTLRAAFATIAERVEQSLFALRQLSAEDWQTARAAYADFALAQKSIAT